MSPQASHIQKLSEWQDAEQILTLPILHQHPALSPEPSTTPLLLRVRAEFKVEPVSQMRLWIERRRNTPCGVATMRGMAWGEERDKQMTVRDNTVLSRRALTRPPSANETAYVLVCLAPCCGCGETTMRLHSGI